MPTEYQCKDENGNYIPAMAVAYDQKEGCITLSPDKISNNIDHFILDSDKNDGIKLHYSGVYECDEIRDFDLTIDIKCDKKAETI